MEKKETTDTVVVSPDVSEVIKNADVRKMSMSSDAFAAALSGQSPVTSSKQEDSSSADDSDEGTETQNIGEESRTKDAQETEKEQEYPKGVRSRFKVLTEARDRAEQRAADLEARLADLEKRSNSVADEKTASSKTESDGIDFGFDKLEPDPKEFKTVSEYTKALTKWEIARDFAERKYEEQRQQSEKQVVQKFETFFTKGQEIEKELGLSEGDFSLLIKDPDFKMSDEAKSAILDHEQGPRIAFEIASDVDLKEKFERMSPVAQLVYVGRLGAKFEDNSEPKGGNAKTKAKPIGTQVKGSAAKPSSIRHVPLNQITATFKDQREFRKALGEE